MRYEGTVYPLAREVVEQLQRRVYPLREKSIRLGSVGECPGELQRAHQQAEEG